MPGSSTPATDSRRWLTLVVVGLAQLMVVLDATVVNIALPSAQADLGFSDGQRQWIVTAYSLAFGSLLLLGGRLSDLMGRKRTFVIGLIGFAIASALGGACSLVRAARRRPRPSGRLRSAPRSDRPRPKLDIPGTLLVSAGLFALVYGFSHAETDGWDSPLTWGMLAGAVVFLGAFVFWQTRAGHPLLPLHIVRDRNRGAAYLSVMIAGAGMFGIFLFVTYYLQLTLGYSPIQTGLAFLPMIAMLVLAAQLGTNIFVPRFGPKLLVPIGMTIAASRMVWLTFLDATSTYAGHVMPPLMLIGFAMGTIMPASMQTATLGVDREFAGVASAMVNTSQQVGGSVGTALLNTLAATAATDYLLEHWPQAAGDAMIASYAAAYWWGAGFFAVGAVVSALLFRRRNQGLSLSREIQEENAAEPVLAH
ncbi:MFS transporter [Pseudoclavibacter helvolus]|uniref:MFS transporter n=1 Tax=Pseudoclavibacter helvolus TaxID=255205 RepID=UPI0024AD2E79|nr:MFS transporter [Pseudoclavibacter helvolus]